MTDEKPTSSPWLDGERPWHAKYDPQSDAFLDYEDIPAFEYLDRAARDFPKRTALTFQNWTMNYAELKRTAEIMAANLRRQGVGPGDRVSIMLPNLPQMVIAYWAVLKCGAVGVMTNPLYMEKELTHQLTDSGCKVMILLDMLWTKVEKLRDSLPVEKFIVTGVADGLRFPLSILYRVKSKRGGQAPTIPYDDCSVLPWKTMFRGRDRLSHPPENPRRDPALLQYTGGTTGISKGVMITHFNLTSNVRQCHSIMHAFGNQPETFLCILPFFHIYALTVSVNLGTSIGANLLLVPRYVPRDILNLIHKKRPTIFPGAPAVYTSLIQQKDIRNFDFSCIDWCVSGSAPMPVEPMQRFEDLTGARIVEGYGLTEASPVTHLNPLKGVRKMGSIGMPFPDTDCRIVDLQDGESEMPVGEAGEMCIKGPQVMRGYWNRPEETAASLRDGWLYTGDVAVMDEEGYFTIVDRKKDLVIIGGYNVYPREIDEVLYEHPKIKEAVAVGVPHATRGEIIKAFVVPREDETLTRAEITSWCRDRLANYKVPRQVEFRDELPKTMVGKVLRRTLRDEEARKVKDEMAAKEKKAAAKKDESGK